MDEPVYTNTESTFPVLKGLEPVRLRPGMWVGDTDLKGYHQLVIVAIDFLTIELLNGYGTQIDVTLLDAHTVQISGDGRGFSVLPYREGGTESSLEIELTLLQAGYIEDKCYDISGSMHGAGIVVDTALSSQLTVDNYRDGTHYRISYKHGEQASPLQSLGDTAHRGMTFTFTPDPEIFGDTLAFAPERLRDYLRHLAYLLPAATFTLTDISVDFRTFRSDFLLTGGLCPAPAFTQRGPRGR